MLTVIGIVGEPKSGKTTTARKVVEDLSLGGARVIWFDDGRSTEWHGLNWRHIPYSIKSVDGRDFFIGLTRNLDYVVVSGSATDVAKVASYLPQARVTHRHPEPWFS